MMIPVEALTGKMLSGKLAGFVSGRSIRSHPSQSITESWPGNVSRSLDDLTNGHLKQESFLYTYQTFLSALNAASMGAVAIMPDFLGYGESYAFNRTFYNKQSYQQAFALSWIAAKIELEELTNGCSVLRKEATITGKFK